MGLRSTGLRHSHGRTETDAPWVLAMSENLLMTLIRSINLTLRD